MGNRTATMTLLLAVGLGCSGDAKQTGMSMPATPGTPAAGGSVTPSAAGSNPSSTPGLSGAAGASTAAMPATGGGAGNPVGDAGASAMASACPSCPIPPSCQGLPLEGMQYSPGGSVLPNKCEPFNSTTNNPYAIRCIDAIPGFKTQFPGDQFCILPPPPDKGIQVGVHPQGDTDAYWAKIWAGDFSDYDNPGPEWMLMPGDEVTQNYMTTAHNADAFNYFRTYFRMRTGSHHNIISLHMSSAPDGWISNGGGEALPGPFDPTSGTLVGILGGQQRPDDGEPATLDKAPEDEGLYLKFPAAPRVLFNMHHFNATSSPVLREGWVNIWFEPDARTLVSWYMGMEPTQVIGLSVAPGETKDLHYSFAVNAETRVMRVFGHRHFWTPNFSTWIERASGGDPEPIYQSYDWFDMPTYQYNTLVQNPPVNPGAKTDGAASGVVMLHPGDKMHFNCHIEFTDARAAEDAHAPTPETVGTLHFANEVYNGEMCIQYGNVTGGTLGLPSIDNSPVPDFAKLVN